MSHQWTQLTDTINKSIYKPDSKNVGTLYKLWIKTECNDVEVSNFNILFRIQHRWHIKCLNWENVSFSGKNKLILNFMASTHLKKVGTRPCLPLCGIPSSFYNSLQMSGDWGDKLLKFRNRMLSHSCLIQPSSCSTVLGFFVASSSLWCAKCFLWVKDLDCRLAISVPGSFFYAAMML